MVCLLNYLKRIKFLVFTSIFFLTLTVTSQERKIYGKIKDSTQNPVLGISLVVKNTNDDLIGYDISKDDGSYAITFSSEEKKINLVVRGLGYKTQNLQINLVEKTLKKDIVLEDATEELKEIIIESKRKVIVKKDTVTYRIKSFINDTEDTVEDVLKKLPGIEVEDDGKISYGGKEIEKILIEGDDLTSSNYKILSRNLDANLLKNVQILKNYEDNPLLKRFDKSEKIALNLTIKDSKKNKWFSSILTGIGTNKRYNINFNLGLIKKKIKLLNLSKINNNGYPVTEGNNRKIKSNTDPISKRETKAKVYIPNNVTRIGNLKLNESLLNNSELTSLTSVSKISEKTKLRTLFYISEEDVSFKNDKQKNYNYNTSIISYKEQTSRLQNIGDIYGNIELINYTGEKWYNTFESKWLREKNVWNSKIKANENEIGVKSETEQQHLFNHFKTTYAPSSTTLWQNYVYFTMSKNEEKQTLINSFIPLGFKKDTIIQTPQSKNLFFGVSSEISVKKKNSTINYNLNIENEKRDLLSKIKPLNEENEIDTLKFDFKQRFLNINNSVKFKQDLTKTTSISSDISYLYKFDFESNKNFKLPKIKIGLKSNIGFGVFALSTEISRRIFDVTNFYEGFLIKEYRNLYFNNSITDTYIEKNIGFSHTLNYANRGFYTTTLGSVSYRNKSMLMKENITENNSFFLNSIIEKYNKSIFLDNHTTWYYHTVKTSFTLSNNFNLFENYINGLNNENVKFKSYSHDIKLNARTYFKFPINFNIYYQKLTNWNVYKNNSSTLTSSSIGSDINYKIDKKWQLSAKLNHYQIQSNSHNFLSSEVLYKPEKGKISYKLKAHNLLNVKLYYQSSNYGYSNNISATNIIPRYIMLYVNYRF